MRFYLFLWGLKNPSNFKIFKSCFLEDLPQTQNHIVNSIREDLSAHFENSMH